MKHKIRRISKSKKKKYVVLIVCILVLVVLSSVLLYSMLGKPILLLRPVPSGLAFNLPSESVEGRIQHIREFLDDEHILYTDISIASDSAIVVSLNENGDIYLSQEHYAEELTSLQVIVSKLTMEDKRFRRLDLRFKRPVIVMQ